LAFGGQVIQAGPPGVKGAARAAWPQTIIRPTGGALGKFA